MEIIFNKGEMRDRLIYYIEIIQTNMCLEYIVINNVKCIELRMLSPFHVHIFFFLFQLPLIYFRSLLLLQFNYF
jgi:hypothetical protein